MWTSPCTSISASDTTFLRRLLCWSKAARRSVSSRINWALPCKFANLSSMMSLLTSVDLLGSSNLALVFGSSGTKNQDFTQVTDASMNSLGNFFSSSFSVSRPRMYWVAVSISGMVVFFMVLILEFVALSINPFLTGFPEILLRRCAGWWRLNILLCYLRAVSLFFHEFDMHASIAVSLLRSDFVRIT